MDYDGYFADALIRLRSENRYRVFIELERMAGRYPHAIWHSQRGPREVVVWCSIDYLGMGSTRRSWAPWSRRRCAWEQAPAGRATSPGPIIR